MRYYIHVIELYDGQLQQISNKLFIVNSSDELFLKLRSMLFEDDEDETDYLNMEISELIYDLKIEISIFNNNLENIFNFNRLDKSTWGDFENMCFSLKENILSYSKFLESKKPKFPDIKKFEYNGFTIYMGRDAKSNDYLTFNIADGEDIWLHTKGVPGSHVVIRVRENLPTDDVIRFAAEIAKKNSRGKSEQNIPVVYCQRRFVKKEKGMNDGQVRVDYINAYEINI